MPTIAHGVFGTSSGFGVGKGLISVFQGFSASIGKAFILAGGGGGAGRWAIILWGLDTFLIFPNFLSLKLFGNS